MKMTIESTNEFFSLDGIDTRLWKGKTETGIEVECFIHRLTPLQDDNLEQFENELCEQMTPIAFVHYLESKAKSEEQEDRCISEYSHSFFGEIRCSQKAGHSGDHGVTKAAYLSDISEVFRDRKGNFFIALWENIHDKE